MLPHEITPSDLYSHFSEVSNRVRWAGESFTITRREDVVARIVNAKERLPSDDGVRRYPRPEFSRMTPGEFRRKMKKHLEAVRYGGPKPLIVDRANKIVMIVIPGEPGKGGGFAPPAPRQ
jgi:antitoxin (DNA-binding transcriptional repressor) of toxin-antitoxin stability system